MAASRHIYVVTADTFEEVVLQSPQPVVVDFWAPWCGPCRRVAPILDELAAEMHDRLRFVSVNVDTEPSLADRFQILSIPTIKLFESGREVAAVVGAGSKEQIRSTFEKWLRDLPGTPLMMGA